MSVKENIKNAKAGIRRLSPNDGFHYFYGYYDNPAFSKNNEWHLCHRVNFWGRLPVKDDICELGAVNIKTSVWEKLAETAAFNFQQGSMLQWYPANRPDLADSLESTDSEESSDSRESEAVIYNIRDGNEYRSVVHNIRTGHKRVLPAAIANVSQDGKWGLAINMNRIYDFRPGYGYSGNRDKWHDIPQPQDDGIRVINMETGGIEFILDCSKIGILFSIDPNEKTVINHITFNPGSSRILFLIRTFPSAQKGWLTGLGTIGRDGKNFCMMNPMSLASHYHWRDRDHLLIWAKINDVTGMYLLTDQKNEAVLLDPDFFRQDIHCIYSPDRRYILGDGYFDKVGYRQIFLYDTYTRKGQTLLEAYSDPAAVGDIRCDLHNRWSRDGRFISFDSTHEGFRGLYLMDLTEI